MNQKLTFSHDDVQRAARKIGVLRLALWFLVIMVPMALVLSAAFQLIPAFPLYARAVAGLCGFSVAGGLFIWKFIRMAQEGDA